MAQGAALTRQEKRGLHTQRKARTRTLIQVGGLCKVAGLLEIFGIEEGMELQLSPEGQERASRLLGWLVESAEGLPGQKPDEEAWQGWKTTGERTLKVHQAKKYR
jgi:hypothetical protein